MVEIVSDNHSYWNQVYEQFHNGSPSRMSVWNEEPTPFFTRLIDFLRYSGVKTIMDAGCGDGRNIKQFLESGFKVIGVESSTSALDICRKHFVNHQNLELVQADLTSVSFSNGIDALMCDHVLTHVRNVNRAIDNFYNLLKRRGYALIEFTSPLDSTYGKGEKISDREFLQKGVYLRYDTLDDVHKMMKKFDVLCFTSEHSTDPPHGSGYIRDERHAHHSYFVLARKK